MPILARILRDRGIVTERQLQEAIQHQVLYGGRLGTNLYELGFITEERLQEALARAHGVPGAAVDVREIQPESRRTSFPRQWRPRTRSSPTRSAGKTLFLAHGRPRRPLGGGQGGLLPRLHREAPWWCRSSA